MTSASSLLSEDQFLCSICMDVFTDPITTPCGHNYCKACITYYWDTNDVCKCPLCRKLFYGRPEVFVNNVISGLAGQIRKSLQLEEEGKKAGLRKIEMIQGRQVKFQDIKHSVELSRKDADREIADSVFSALISIIERSQAELIDVIEEKQKTTEKHAEGFINELQQQITQLEKRSSELKPLSHTEDHLHLLQNFTSINTPPPTKDWTKVNVHQSLHEVTLRAFVAQLENTLCEEMKKMCVAELRRIQQYEVDVTLDPNTAHPNLILSEDGKQVSCGTVKKNLPDNTERFSEYINVLGKQGFSSGMFYYEVQVKGKTEWNLGVARESINRKDASTLSPQNGKWTIMLRNGNEYKAAAGPDVLLPVREEVQKVGVFVDYEEGLVSFYDVETRVHLYSFTRCTFTEKLFPFLSPRLKRGGRNSAPLIISPVNHID